MPRIYPEVPLTEVMGEIASVPRRYERITEYSGSFEVASGLITGSTIVTLLPNVYSRDILSLRAYLSTALGDVWNFYILDSEYRKVYINELIPKGVTEIIDSNLRIPVSGNLIVVFRYAKPLPTTITVSFCIGTREIVLEV